MKLSPSSGVDQLVSGLRLRLSEQSRSKRPLGGGRSIGAGKAGPNAIQAMAALEGVDDRQLKRALIQNLLGEHFGPDLIADASFQQVVDRVTDTIEADQDGAELLTNLAAELRASAR